MLSWSRALLTCKTVHGQLLKVMELEAVSNEWHMCAFPVGFNLGKHTFPEKLLMGTPDLPGDGHDFLPIFSNPPSRLICRNFF